MKKRRYSYKNSARQLIFYVLALSITLLGTWIYEHVDTFHPIETNELVDVYSTDSGQLERRYVHSIQSAKKSILIMIFALTNDRVLNAIKQKSLEGVKVKVVCDAKACPRIIERLGPQVEIVRRLDKGLMHLKILVVDEEDCWLGSANFTGESLNMHSNLVIQIKDKALAKTLEQKAESLKEYDRIGNFGYSQYNVGGQLIELVFLPDDKRGSIRLKELMRSANKTIKVAMYTFTRRDFAKELIDAKRRGVDVTVVLDRSSAFGSSAEVNEILKQAGITLRYSVGKALLHHKTMIVDDKILELGSANWTSSAFNKNDDCYLIINNLSSEQKEQLKQVWQEILNTSSF